MKETEPNTEAVVQNGYTVSGVEAEPPPGPDSQPTRAVGLGYHQQYLSSTSFLAFDGERRKLAVSFSKLGCDICLGVLPAAIESGVEMAAGSPRQWSCWI